MREVLVKVIGTQTDAGGEESRVEVVTRGTRHEKNGVSYVAYHESEVSGMDGAKTLLKVFSDHFVVVRQGLVEQNMKISSDQKCDGQYITPYGVMNISVDTKKMDMVVCGDYISLYAAYDLAIDDQWQSANTLTVSVREEE
ncbi:MAG: hypothetical protein H6Q74_1611 [Firmicutes bacterium]|nr:hypothetical protein [Bacillota bacterium]